MEESQSSQKDTLIVVDYGEGDLAEPKIKVAAKDDPGEPGKKRLIDPEENKEGASLTLNGRDMVDNFIANLYRQYKQPMGVPTPRFSFFWTTAKNAGNLIYQIGKALFAGDNQAQGIVNQDAYKFDPRYRFTKEEIDEGQLRDIGLSLDSLNEKGANGKTYLDELCAGKRTSGLLDVTVRIGGEDIPAKARLSLRRNPETGEPEFGIHCQREKIEVREAYHNYQFTEEEGKELEEKGYISHPVMLQKRGMEKPEPHLISTDPLTNEIVSIRQAACHPAPERFQTRFSVKELADARDGKEFFRDNLKTYDGRTFSAYIRYDAFERNYVLRFPEGNVIGQNDVVPKRIGNRAVTKEEWDKITSGTPTDLGDGLTNKAGKRLPPIVWQDQKTGKWRFAERAKIVEQTQRENQKQTRKPKM